MRRLGRLASAIGLAIGLAPAVAHAQTNLDEGKSPTQIFASDCSVCHKSPKGLAKGRGAGGIAGFLRQHYTTGQEQAAALAAYILGAGGDSSEPQTRARKPAAERTAKPAEEPSAKPARQVRRPPRTEEAPGPAAKLQQPNAEEEIKPETTPIAVEEPSAKPSRKPPARGRKPAAAEQEAKTNAAARGRRAAPSSPESAAPEPARVEPPSPPAEPATTAASPAVPPSDLTPIPRDDIPD